MSNEKESNSKHERRSTHKTANNELTILEIYKLHVEMADRVSQRRVATNNWFITLNTSIIAAGGLVFNSLENYAIFLIVICLIGVGLSVVWRGIILSYKQLNSAKFRVINAIESEFLPIQPFINEYNAYTSDKRRDFTDIEQHLPLLLIILYCAALTISIFYLFE